MLPIDGGISGRVQGDVDLGPAGVLPAEMDPRGTRGLQLGTGAPGGRGYDVRELQYHTMGVSPGCGPAFGLGQARGMGPGSHQDVRAPTTFAVHVLNRRVQVVVGRA